MRHVSIGRCALAAFVVAIHAGCTSTGDGSAEDPATGAPAGPTPTLNVPPGPAPSGTGRQPASGAPDASVEAAASDDASASTPEDASAPPDDASVVPYDAEYDVPSCIPKNRAQLCVPFPGRPTPCGLQDDGCDGGIDCGGCYQSAQICWQGTCCVPSDECRAPDGRLQCGQASDGCGGSHECGECQRQGDVCYQNVCCTPGASCMQNGARQCGPVDDGCGGSWDCGGCANGDVCNQGLCCTPHPDCSRPDGRVVCGTQLDDGCGGKSACPSCGWGECGSGGVCNCSEIPAYADLCARGAHPVGCDAGTLPGSQCSQSQRKNVWCCP